MPNKTKTTKTVKQSPVEAMLAQLLAGQAEQAKELERLKAENAQLTILATTKAAEKKKPNAHGYLKPVETKYTIERGPRKGQTEDVMQFPHHANPAWSFSISRNKAAAIKENWPQVDEWATKHPPKE